MSRSQPVRILIADSRMVVREGLAAILRREMDVEIVAEAASGSEALAQYRLNRPDIVLMDICLPDMDGVAAITAIREQHPSARIIIFTLCDGDEDIYRSVRAGAKAYLLHSVSREELLEAIRCVYAGRTHFPPEIAAKLSARLCVRELTAREYDVLKLMAAGKSNQEIGRVLFITESTVKAHVNSLLGKLNVSDRTQAVTTALRRGLVRLE